VSMEKIKLPHAIVIVSVMFLMAFLVWKGVDSAPTVLGILTVLGGLGFVVHNQGQQGERSANIQTTVNGNTNRLVDVINQQQQEFRTFVTEHQHAMAVLVADHERHMREMADKMAEMIPPSAVPQVITLPVLTENGSSTAERPTGAGRSP